MVARCKGSNVMFARRKAICAAVAACFNTSVAYANPTGPQVAAGQASFNTQGPLLSITNTPGTVINWQRFSISAGETTRFVQQSAQSAVLNRVITADPSVILGTLASNGRVFLINPSGILVGAGGRVDVAGFVASTLNLTNEDFAAGRLRFQPVPNAGSVVNEGVITSPSGGQVYLIAPTVTNVGAISTPKGETILAAGNHVELVDTGAPGVRVQIDVPGGEVKNLGQIVADSGRVGIVGALVQNRGRLSADQVVGDGTGRIFLKASQTTTIAAGGAITANGTRGGSIEISGDQGVTVEKTAAVQSNGIDAGGNIAIASSSGNAMIAGSLQANGATGGIVTLHAAGDATLDGAVETTGGGIAGGRIDVTSTAGISIGDTGVLRASGARGGTVYIEARRDNNSSGTASLAGLLDVYGHEGEGGKALLLGPRVAILRNGAIEASGRRGGGIALVGGDYQGRNPNVPNATATYVGPDTSIRADAVAQGDGGKVIVWSDEATRAYGVISARGGAESGKGGFVETSGHSLDVDGVRVNVGAAHGQSGLWLLDPTDIELNNDISDAGVKHDPTFKPAKGGARLTWATIKNNLGTGAVTVTTSGSSDTAGETGTVKIKSGASYNSSFALSLQGVDSLDVDADITNSGTGGISLHATTVNVRANVSTGTGGVSVSATNANFSSGTVKLNGTYSVAGTTTINGGTANFDADASVPTLTLSSGTLGGSAKVTTDSLNWTGGALVGSLTLSNGKSGTVSTGAKYIGNNSGGKGSFTNKGAITDSTPGGSSALHFYDGTFNNQGTYSFTTDAVFTDEKGTGIVNNTGAFKKTGGAGTSTISVKFVNATDGTATGVVIVDSGTLKFSPPSSSSASHTGTFSVGTGAALQFANGTHDVSGEFSGSGDLAVQGGTFTATGAYRLTGQMSFVAGTSTLTPSNGSMKPSSVGLSGGTVKFNGNVTTPTFKFEGGSLSGSGFLTVSKAFSRTGGTIDGTVGGLDVTQDTGDLVPGALAADGKISLVTKAGALKLDSISATSIHGRTTAGDLTLNPGSALSASGQNDALVLVSANNFVNNAGASAVSTPNGRWLVYSKDPALDVRGGLSYGFKHYGMAYDGTSYSGPGTGNGFLYSAAPSVTPSLAGAVSKIYDGTTAASLTSGNYVTTGAIDDDVIAYSTAVAAAYADKNAGSGKTVSTKVSLGSASNGSVKVYGYRLSRSDLSAGIGKIEKALLSFKVSGQDKVYDGTAAATLSGGTLSGIVGNDVVRVTTSAVFADKNVGAAKAITASGTLSGPDAANYMLAKPGPLSADITARPLATWVGTTGGLWSNSANWDQGIVPEAANVVAVSIPSSAGSIVYDATAGSTTLRTLDAGQSLILKGGSLTLGSSPVDISTVRNGSTLELQSGGSLIANGTLSAAAYLQTGGSLAGTGNFIVSNQFRQNGGTIALTGAASATITQVTGDLLVGSLAAPAVVLTARNGAIGQSSVLAASALTASATGGITLTDAGNRIARLTAQNTGSGALALVNAAPLTIASLSNSGGNIAVDNTGAITTTGAVSASAGDVSIRAHSPLTIGAGGVSAGGNIALTAGQTAGSDDNLNLSGSVSSSAKGGMITLSAGDDLVQNASVTSNEGAISANAQSGNLSMALGAITGSGGGAVAYTAPTGNIALTRLDAGTGSVAVTAGLNTTSTFGYTGANLIGKSAVITSGGSVILATQVQRLQMNIGGAYSITDAATGNITTNAPAVAAPARQAEQSVVTAVVSSTKTATSATSTTVSTTPAADTSASSSAAAVASTAAGLGTGGAGTAALPVKTDPNGTIGGTPGEFGGTRAASAGPSDGDAGKTDSGQKGESKDGLRQKRVAQAAEKPSESKSASKKAAVCR